MARETNGFNEAGKALRLAFSAAWALRIMRAMAQPTGVLSALKYNPARLRRERPHSGAGPQPAGAAHLCDFLASNAEVDVGAAIRSEPNQATKFGRAKPGHKNAQGLVEITSKLSRCNGLRVVG